MARKWQSEVIERLLDSAQAVEDSITHHGPLVAPILDRMFAAEFAALGERPNFLATLLALRDRLAASRRELAAAEMRHIKVERGISALVADREDLFEELHGDFTWLRGALEKHTGAFNTAVLAGFQGPTAKGSTKLLWQVRIAARALSQPGLELPPLRFGSVAVNAGQAAAELRSKATRFARLRRRLRRLRREAEITRKEKNRQIARHRELFVPLCQTVEGYYRLAGEHELADKIRPSLRTRGRRVVDLEEPIDGTAEDGTAEDETLDEDPAAAEG